MYHLIL